MSTRQNRKQWSSAQSRRAATTCLRSTWPQRRERTPAWVLKYRRACHGPATLTTCSGIYHLRRLRVFKLPSKGLRTFYTCTIESIAIGHITAWAAVHPSSGAGASRKIVKDLCCSHWCYCLWLFMWWIKIEFGILWVPQSCEMFL